MHIDIAGRMVLDNEGKVPVRVWHISAKELCHGHRADTFLYAHELHVITDDWYQKVILPKLPVCGGPAPKLCDSEVLCLALAAQWRSGVPWQTERGFVRYALKHLRPFFPGMTDQSAFNRRVRRLWGAFILLQGAISGHLLAADDCEVLDCVPVRVAHGSRSFHPGWLADIAAIGKGGKDRYFYGLHRLLVVSASGLPTGWTLAAGNVQDRWLAQLLLSARAGQAQLTGPLKPTGEPRVEPPTAWVGPAQSCGMSTTTGCLIAGSRALCWPVLARALGYRLCRRDRHLAQQNRPPVIHRAAPGGGDGVCQSMRQFWPAISRRSIPPGALLRASPPSWQPMLSVDQYQSHTRTPRFRLSDPDRSDLGFKPYASSV